MKLSPKLRALRDQFILDNVVPTLDIHIVLERCISIASRYSGMIGIEEQRGDGRGGIEVLYRPVADQIISELRQYQVVLSTKVVSGGDKE